MKVQWKKQSGQLLVSSCILVQPKRGREEPTMTRATRTAEYTGPAAPCLYLAFELGSAEWKLGFTTEPGATPRVRTMPARDCARFTREIADAKLWFGVKTHRRLLPTRGKHHGGVVHQYRLGRETPGPPQGGTPAPHASRRAAVVLSTRRAWPRYRQPRLQLGRWEARSQSPT